MYKPILAALLFLWACTAAFADGDIRYDSRTHTYYNVRSKNKKAAPVSESPKTTRASDFVEYTLTPPKPATVPAPAYTPPPVQPSYATTSTAAQPSYSSLDTWDYGYYGYGFYGYGGFGYSPYVTPCWQTRGHGFNQGTNCGGPAVPTNHLNPFSPFQMRPHFHGR